MGAPVYLIPHSIVLLLKSVTFNLRNKLTSTFHPLALFPITSILFITFICVVISKTNGRAF